jgi:high-affinity nickel permease
MTLLISAAVSALASIATAWRFQVPKLKRWVTVVITAANLSVAFLAGAFAVLLSWIY